MALSLDMWGELLEIVRNRRTGVHDTATILHASGVNDWTDFAKRRSGDRVPYPGYFRFKENNAHEVWAVRSTAGLGLPRLSAYLDGFVSPAGCVATRRDLTSPVKKFCFHPEVVPLRAEEPPRARMVDPVWNAENAPDAGIEPSDIVHKTVAEAEAAATKAAAAAQSQAQVVQAAEGPPAESTPGQAEPARGRAGGTTSPPAKRPRGAAADCSATDAALTTGLPAPCEGAAGPAAPGLSAAGAPKPLHRRIVQEIGGSPSMNRFQVLRNGHNFHNRRHDIKDFRTIAADPHVRVFPEGYFGNSGPPDKPHDMRVLALNMIDRKPTRGVATFPSLPWLNTELEPPRQPMDTRGVKFVDSRGSHAHLREPPLWLPEGSIVREALVTCGSEWGPSRRVTMADLLPHIPRSDESYFSYREVPVATGEVVQLMLDAYKEYRGDLRDPPSLVDDECTADEAGRALLSKAGLDDILAEADRDQEDDSSS
mmetsp:Transcript_10679/g.22218  ORF Transcript_10679/g.22218 Transcript_10679/m.22218 type:complete len:482 (-) Transcript_10679:310-1755(-)